MDKVLITAITASEPNPVARASWFRQTHSLTQVLIRHQDSQKFPMPESFHVALNVASNREGARLDALATDADYILFVDEDICLPENAVEQFLGQSKLHPTAAIAGYYPLKDRNRKLCNEFAIAIFASGQNSSGLEPIFFTTKPFPSVSQVDFAGLGCLLIGRSELEKIRIKVDLTRLFYVTNSGGVAWSDDSFDFCNQLAEHNIPLYADSSVICDHL